MNQTLMVQAALTPPNTRGEPNIDGTKQHGPHQTQGVTQTLMVQAARTHQTQGLNQTLMVQAARTPPITRGEPNIDGTSSTDPIKRKGLTKH